MEAVWCSSPTGRGTAATVEIDAEPAVARSLLIVEDDDILRGRLARAFRDQGFDVREAADAPGALETARTDPPEYALVDLRLGTQSGLDVVRGLAELDPATVIVVLTGYGSIANALEAVRLSAAHHLTKPADVDGILAAFARTNGAPEVPAPDVTPTLARVEWEHQPRAGGLWRNVSQAARLLGSTGAPCSASWRNYPTAR
jgi:two-component system response regulator RegA